MGQDEKVFDKMVRTWIADVSSLYEESTYERLYRAAPEFRREKADRIRSKEHRAQSIGAWTLYEKARLMCKASEEAIFNLSHSGHFVLCSIEDNETIPVKVGCDIEEIKKLHTKLIKRFLTSEQDYILEKQTEEERTDAFYRFWVLKESFMKATRYGMRLGLDTFEIQCDPCEAPRLIMQPDMIKEQYYFKEYKAGIPYKIAVCSTNSFFAEEIQKVDL